MHAENHGDDLLSQAEMDSSDANTPGHAGDESSAIADVDALRAEVAKWQERVPKLAQALRERTDELATLRDEIRQLKQSPVVTVGDEVDQRLATRDEHIKELEAKLDELAQQHRSVAGDLHASQLACGEAEKAAQEWKAKWQAANQNLDEALNRQVAQKREVESQSAAWQTERTQLAEQHVKEQERDRRELDSLRKRNEQLAETTELANKQIASLGEELQQLMTQQAVAQEQVATQTAAAEAAQVQAHDAQQARDALEIQVAELSAQLNAAQTAHAEDKTALDAAQSELEPLKGTIERLTQELQDLESVRANLTTANNELNAKHSEQTTRLADVELNNEHVHAELRKAHDRLRDVTTQVASLSQELNVVRSARDQLQVEFEQAREGLAPVQEQLDQTRRELAELEAVRADLTQANADLEHKLAEEHATGQAAQAENTRLNTAVSQTREQLSDVERQLEALTQARSEERQALEVQYQKDLTAAVAERDAQVGELRAEVQRLEECLAHAQDAQSRREGEWQATRNQMSNLQQEIGSFGDKIKSRDAEIARLKLNLEERSGLVVELEQQLENAKQLGAGAAAEKDGFEREIEALTNKLSTFQAHAAGLEDRIESQRNLMGNLEGELTQAQGNVAQSAKQIANLERDNNRLQQQLSQIDPSAKQKLEEAMQENDDLKLRNQKLEDDLAAYEEAVDELTKELKVAEARSQEAASAEAEVAQAHTEAEQATEQVQSLQQELHQAKVEITALRAESVGTEDLDRAREQVRELEQLLRERTKELDDLTWRLKQEQNQADENIVLVLNQQLQDARDELERLKSNPNDDLTQLKGVGQKLAEQLATLGYCKLQQFALLNEEDLENENHPLAGFKARIVRDEWIAQARDLVAG